MNYPWQFRIMHIGDGSRLDQYSVRHEVGRYLSTFYTLAETLTLEFVPDDVKKSVRCVLAAAKFKSTQETTR